MTESDGSAVPSEKGSEESEEFAFTPDELVDWVERLFAMIESVDRSQGASWCPQWWNHPEAIDRSKSLYDRWLQADKDQAMSSWWVDHFDRHAAVLFAKRGPFGGCGTKHVPKTERKILTTELPPAEWSW